MSTLAYSFTMITGRYASPTFTTLEIVVNLMRQQHDWLLSLLVQLLIDHFFGDHGWVNSFIFTILTCKIDFYSGFYELIFSFGCCYHAIVIKDFRI